VDLEIIFIQMEQNIKDNGKMISRMVKVNINRKVILARWFSFYWILFKWAKTWKRNIYMGG